MLKLSLLCLLGVCLAGCSVLPEHRSPPPELGIPPTWAGGAQDSAVQPWLQDFADPVLRVLTEDAVEANHDLRAATARVRAAQADARIGGADRLPQISASFSASRNKRNSTGGFTVTSARTDNFGLDGEISWEADIWGKLYNQAHAATLDLRVSQAEYNAARLSLAANIARAWFNAIEARLQRDLASDTAENFQNNLEVIEEGFRGGINSALDVRLQRANVATARSRLASEKARYDANVRTLEVLLGRYPSSELKTAAQLPELARDVPAGLPSELLNRRPDLIAARLRLAAADERVNQAQKNLLPSLRLTASGGTSASELRDLVDLDFIVWTLASNLAAPVFQGGRLRAEVERARARDEELLAAYAQTALQAFQEVETAMSAEAWLADQEAALQIAANESKEAEVLALEQYRDGLAGIVTLLESQRRSFDSQSALIQTANQRLQNRVDLYLALGGDFAAPSLNAAN
ncbi:MAG: efflux transporter outer membrane subunit [Gammaproteobacteria bacterium]